MIRRSRSSSRSSGWIRILVALAFAAFAVISFLGSREFNPVTGEDQYVSLTREQEIRLGLESIPTMLEQFGPPLDNDDAQDYIDEIGFLLVDRSVADDTVWQWEFTIINNPELVNAFALPGGQIFVTTALINEFETEAQLAGVLSHEIVHVLARHSSQQLAKQELTQGLIGAIAIGSEDMNTARAAAVFAQVVNVSYSRDAETQSDLIGVEVLVDGGYDPYAMAEVMAILARASGGAAGPEFLSTHPNPDNRIERIEAKIEEMEANGEIPNDLATCIVRCEN